jgi:hypothetical protein
VTEKQREVEGKHKVHIHIDENQCRVALGRETTFSNQDIECSQHRTALSSATNGSDC